VILLETTSEWRMRGAIPKNPANPTGREMGRSIGKASGTWTVCRGQPAEAPTIFT
jgi:hypothetical protein